MVDSGGRLVDALAAVLLDSEPQAFTHQVSSSKARHNAVAWRLA
jgi:hypothetical protein